MTYHQITSSNVEELNLDELMQVTGGGENSKAFGYFVGHMLGEAAAVVEKYGTVIAKVLK